MNRLYVVSKTGIDELKVLCEFPDYYILDEVLMGSCVSIANKISLNPHLDNCEMGRNFYTGLKPALAKLARIISVEEKMISELKNQLKVHSLAE